MAAESRCLSTLGSRHAMRALTSFAEKANPIFAFAIIFLFLFSNLIDRIYPVGASAAFYAVVGLAAALQCVAHRLVAWQYAVIGVAGYFVLSPLLKGESVLVAVAATKDLALPLSGILLGYFLLRSPRNMEILNCLYLPFIGYGLLQAVTFHTGTLATVLPWDAAYIQSMRDAGLSVYQTDLLRFFGTFNSFFHYQLLCVLVPILLWVRRDQIRHHKLLIVNTVLAYFFLVLMKERTPLAVLAFLSISAIIFMNGRWRVAGVAALAGVVLAMSLAVAMGPSGAAGALGGKVAPNESDADLRMKNLVTMEVKKDASVKARVEIWQDMLTYITPSNALLGFSAGKLLPGYEAWNPEKLISPHNLYLFFVLAYGIVGLVLFFGLLSRLVWAVRGGGWPRSDMNVFVFSLGLAYLLIGILHLSLLSKLGFFFWWVLGIGMSDRDAANSLNASSRNRDTVAAGAKS